MDKSIVLTVCLNKATDFNLTIKLCKLFHAETQRLKIICDYISLIQWLSNIELIRNLTNITEINHQVV